MTGKQIWSDRIGQRIVVRYRLHDGTQNDAVGELTAVDDALHVIARSGPVHVPLGDVVAGKVVPPRPSRPGPAHLVTSVTDLQRVLTWHWQAPEQEWAGGWLLRAAGGFTNRANSALPLGPPATALPEALDQVRAWYRARGLPPRLSVAGPAEGGVPDDDGPANAVRHAALADGWEVLPGASALVMAARTADLRARIPCAGAPVDLPGGLRLAAADTPDDAWLAGYRSGDVLPPVAKALLLSSPEQVFVSLLEDDRTVGVARGSLGGGAAALTAVEVSPGRRRRGLGTMLLRTVVDWAARTGTAVVYLQVAEQNEVARAVYERAGFVVHHRYDYLRSPAEA